MENNSGGLILIDTCVVQAAGDTNKSKSEAVLSLFNNFKDQKYQLGISEITIYENLQGLWGKKALGASSLFEKFESKIVSREVLVLASRLGGLYGQEYKHIETGDKIIGATAILENGYVLTSNHRDFPGPYWSEKFWLPISFKSGNHTMCTDISLYKPNTQLIIRRIEDREKMNG